MEHEERNLPRRDVMLVADVGLDAAPMVEALATGAASVRTVVGSLRVVRGTMAPAPAPRMAAVAAAVVGCVAAMVVAVVVVSAAVVRAASVIAMVILLRRAVAAVDPNVATPGERRARQRQQQDRERSDRSEGESSNPSISASHERPPFRLVCWLRRVP